MEFIEVHWTAANLEEARKVAELACLEKQAACVQIYPSIESHYIWKGQLEMSQEVKIVFKTKRECFTVLKTLILQNSSYEVPEIIAVPIIDGSESYLRWIKEATT